MDKCFLIKGTKRFFISELGYVFKVCRKGIKEEVVPLKIKQGIPRVRIENQNLNLVLLMLEYFSEKKDFIRYTYKIKNDRITVKNIRLINNKSSDKDESLIIEYKCREKASSHNSRVKNISKITDVDILNSLKRTEFLCFYCGEKIKPRHWHLDHVQPISAGGQNSKENITASCKCCNLMKGSIPLDKFIYQVKKIESNFKNNNH